jgi:nicotinamide mononucleotide adenylyltransferase
MRTIVIYPGRFQPAHKGHKSSYDHLVGKFGPENVFVATSDVTAPVTNPFSFADRLSMLTKLGVPSNRVVQVRNPYQAQEIVKDVPDPANTVLVFAVSEKDMSSENPRFKFGIKKNGEPSYMQPYPKDDKKLQPLTKHAYVMITPTTMFKVKGTDANSATSIRKLYIDGNENDRKQIVHDLYGQDDPALKDMFDKKLLPPTQAIRYGKPAVDGDQVLQGPTLQKEHKQKLVKILESMQHLERQASKCYQVTNEDLIPNYISEKDGRKYY